MFGNDIFCEGVSRIEVRNSLYFFFQRIEIKMMFFLVFILAEILKYC